MRKETIEDWNWRAEHWDEQFEEWDALDLVVAFDLQERGDEFGVDDLLTRIGFRKAYYDWGKIQHLTLIHRDTERWRVPVK